MCTSCHDSAGEDDEPVERVDLGVAAPHRGERVAHEVGLRVEVEHRAARVEHAEVVDVDAALAAQRDRDLLHGTQPERFEQRHERREVDLAAGLVELHPRQTFTDHLVADPDDEAVDLGLEPLEPLDVHRDLVPIGLGRLVVVGEPRTVLRGEQRAPLGTEPRGQVVEQIVLPRAREPLDLLLELLVRDLGDLRARRHVDGEEDLGRLRFAERQVVVDRRAAEPLPEHLLQALAERRAELLARQRHDDRDLPPVEVLADEHADPAVLLELQQPDDQMPKLLASSPGTARRAGTTRRARRPPCSRASRGSGPPRR